MLKLFYTHFMYHSCVVHLQIVNKVLAVASLEIFQHVKSLVNLSHIVE